MDRRNFDRRTYKYIYDCHFANFLLTNGAICKGTGISESTGKIYWAFDYESCQPAYEVIKKNKEVKKVPPNHQAP